MDQDDKAQPAPGNEPSAEDIGAYLRQRDAIEAALKDKFTRNLTVMFTDLKGSTAIAEKYGDLTSRQVIQHHNDILLPAVKENRGTFVKSIGDGTLSHFENALDALRAAVRIQQGIDELNRTGTFPMPVLMRIGMHTGKCILEKNDIFGDVVNTASRFESSANAGEIYLSEETYNALSDKSEIYCRFEREVTLKGKAEPYQAYKAFWSAEEIELDRSGALKKKPEETVDTGRHWVRYAIGFGAVMALVLALAMHDRIRGLAGEDHRSISHTVGEPAGR
ncbi:MAG TPA: adenylate/guanylate cyclase domain-containing protein [Rhodocyclaceae bacterium]